MKNLDIAIRDVAPHKNAERLTGTRADGLPDGVHTGGAWLWNDKVYKPLDGRPYANCDCHYPTLEAEFLAEMQDLELFPKNWEVEERNGRKFLVRDKAYMLQSDKDYHNNVDYKLACKVEETIREVNKRGWELGDKITLGYVNGEWFIADCSNVGRMDGVGPCEANEEYRILNFFKRCGYNRLADRRQKAHHVVSGFKFMEKKDELGKPDVTFQFVYGSYSRPFSLMWASLPDDIEVMMFNQQKNGEIPHTWIITDEPLPQEILDRYELTWCWNPIHKWK